MKKSHLIMKRNRSGIIPPDALSHDIARNVIFMSILLFQNTFYVQHNFFSDTKVEIFMKFQLFSKRFMALLGSF